MSPEDYLAASDLAALLGKRTVIVPPVLLRALFALCWHASRGRIPTPRGAWKFVTFPVAVDGSALTRAYGCRYRFTSAEALMARSGRHLAGIDLTSITVAPNPPAVVPPPEVREV
jgi:hypothetical protein